MAYKAHLITNESDEMVSRYSAEDYQRPQQP